MIEYDLLSRNVADKNKFKEIRDQRIVYKREKNPLANTYKICINAQYGITKDKRSPAYDPRQANNICINGQLLLLDLLEKLEGDCEIIQSNTDGIILQIPDTDEDFNRIDDICHEWETRTRMGLGFDVIREIWQGDVNNYLWINDDADTSKYIWNETEDMIERKGAYVMVQSLEKSNLPIINKALVLRLVKNIPIEVTINECNDLMMFQQIAKISSKFEYVQHGRERLKEKCIRIFASSNRRDAGVFMYSKRTNKLQKIAGTPINCFLVNEDVTTARCEDYPLDKQYYIDMAKTRLFEKFNIDDGVKRQITFDWGY